MGYGCGERALARLDFYFDDAGSPMYPDAKAFIVIDDTARTQIPFSIAATAGGFNNWQIDAAQQALITAIRVTGSS